MDGLDRPGVVERIALWITAICLAVALFAPSCNPDPVPTRAPMFEDEEGWDCRTMGNKICGVDLEKKR